MRHSIYSLQGRLAYQLRAPAYTFIRRRRGPPVRRATIADKGHNFLSHSSALIQFSRAVCSLAIRHSSCCALLSLIVVFSTPGHAQSTASVEGQVTDAHSAVIPAVEITAIASEIGIKRVAVTDAAGQYQIVAVPVGSYRIETRATGFQTQIVESLMLEVGRTVTQNFQLQVGDISQVVTVPTDSDLIEQSTMAVGHIVDSRMVQERPLNGRNFLDLGLQVAGSVTPPQGAFSAAPNRGLGSLAINTGGNR